MASNSQSRIDLWKVDGKTVMGDFSCLGHLFLYIIALGVYCVDLSTKSNYARANLYFSAVTSVGFFPFSLVRQPNREFVEIIVPNAMKTLPVDVSPGNRWPHRARETPRDQLPGEGAPGLAENNLPSFVDHFLENWKSAMTGEIDN